MLVAHLCLTLCNPLDYSLPGCSVHGILQARIPEGAAIPFSRGSFPPRDQTQFSCIAGVCFFFFFFNHLSHKGSPSVINTDGKIGIAVLQTHRSSLGGLPRKVCDGFDSRHWWVKWSTSSCLELHNRVTKADQIQEEWGLLEDSS